MQLRAVAPFTGAWIEITWLNPIVILTKVAPFTGAWIEIQTGSGNHQSENVAPFTGAWIEIVTLIMVLDVPLGRSLHGSVD